MISPADAAEAMALLGARYPGGLPDEAARLWAADLRAECPRATQGQVLKAISLYARRSGDSRPVLAHLLRYVHEQVAATGHRTEAEQRRLTEGRPAHRRHDIEHARGMRSIAAIIEVLT